MAGEGEIDRFIQEMFPKGKDDGVFVDVGAAHPEYLSISLRFRRAGWKVVAIEPNPVFCRLHRDLGHDIHECACGDRDADAVNFYVVDSKGQPYAGGAVTYEAFSSLGLRGGYFDIFNTVPGATIEPIKVPLRRLDTILAENHPSINEIDILSIDVEGYELEVMRGLSVEKYSPKVVILENLFTDPDYHSFMSDKNYQIVAQEPPNEVYVRRL